MKNNLPKILFSIIFAATTAAIGAQYSLTWDSETSNIAHAVSFTNPAASFHGTNVLKTDGSQPLSGYLNMGGNIITNGAGGIGSAEWDTAYGWGDHGAAGYATGTPVYAESDPLALLTNGTRAMGADLDMGGNAVTNSGGIWMNAFGQTGYGFDGVTLELRGDSLLYGNFNVSGNVVTNASYYGNGAGLTNIPGTGLQSASVRSNEIDWSTMPAGLQDGDDTGSSDMFTNWIGVGGWLTLTGGERSGSNTITVVANAAFSNAVRAAQTNDGYEADTDTTYTAGTNLTLHGTTFNMDPVGSNDIDWASMPSGLQDGDDTGGGGNPIDARAATNTVDMGGNRITNAGIVVWQVALTNNSATMNNAAETRINYTHVSIDTHGGWDAALYQYECPVIGIYWVYAQTFPTLVDDGKSFAHYVYLVTGSGATTSQVILSTFTSSIDNSGDTLYSGVHVTTTATNDYIYVTAKHFNADNTPYMRGDSRASWTYFGGRLVRE